LKKKREERFDRIFKQSQCFPRKRESNNSNANDTFSEESNTSEQNRRIRCPLFEKIDIPHFLSDRKSSFPQFLNDKSYSNSRKSTASQTTFSEAMEVDFEINDFCVNPLERNDKLELYEAEKYFNV